MSKTTYIATVVEIDDDGSVFGTTYHEKTPEALAEKVIKHLKTEEKERKLEIVYDETAIVAECGSDNSTNGSGPLAMRAPNEATFYLITKTTELQ